MILFAFIVAAVVLLYGGFVKLCEALHPDGAKQR